MRFKRFPKSTLAQRKAALASAQLIGPLAIKQILAFNKKESAEFQPYKKNVPLPNGQILAITDPILVIIPTTVSYRFMFFERSKDPNFPSVGLGTQGTDAASNTGNHDDCTAEIGSNCYRDWIKFTQVLLSRLPDQNAIIIQNPDTDVLSDLISLQVPLAEEESYLATLEELSQSKMPAYADIVEWQAPRIKAAPVPIDFE